MRLPAYLSGSGKAMLAQLPADEVRRRFTGQLSTRLTSKGPRDIESLLKELALTRKRGYSIDDEAVREGVYSFGAPVFDASGDAVAAIAVCINKAQLGNDRGARHRDAALDVARRLTQRLGGEAAAMSGGDFILETHGLTKEFKGFVAVDNVNLRVRRGTIHALIGPNGAGKTTCFNLLTKFLTPTSGKILFDGDDITAREAGADRAPRHHPLVPDFGRVPAPDGAGERARRPAAQARHLVPLLAARASLRTLDAQRAAICSTEVDLRDFADAADGRPAATAASARWRSPPRWRWSPS